MSPINVVKGIQARWCKLLPTDRQCQEPIQEKKYEKGAISNEINCGGIGTIKWYIIYVILK